MTRRVVLERHAEADLDEQAAFIARDNPAAGLAFLDAVEQAFARLVDYPDMGSARPFRHTRLEGIRMWPVPEYPNRLDLLPRYRRYHSDPAYPARRTGLYPVFPG